MPLIIPRIQALCFDIDGTLRDTDDQLIEQISARLRRLSWLLPGRDSNAFARRFIMGIENPGNSLLTLADRLELDTYLTRLAERVSRSQDPNRSAVRKIIPGVPEMLAGFSDRYPLGVVSAGSERATLEFLEEHDLRRFFTVVISGGTCRRTKPSPEPVIFAARQMGVLPEHCLMIGDTTVDIRAGRLAGAQTAGVLCGFGDEKELARASADLILPTTPMLLNYLPSGNSSDHPTIL